MQNLFDLFFDNTGTATARLTRFFDKAASNEVYLFKKYLDPQSASNVGMSTIMAATERQHKLYVTTLLPEVVYDECEKRIVTGGELIEKLAALFSNMPLNHIKVFTAVLLKSPCGFSYKTVNKYYNTRYGTDFLTVFQVQLANTYDKTKNYKTSLFSATPKMDGLRCYYKALDGTLKTRNNNVHTGFGGIEDVCKLICQRFGLALLDGELYTHKAKFESLSGLIRSTKQASAAKKSVSYIIFAVLPQQAEVFDTPTMVGILNQIRTWLISNNVSYITCVNPITVKNDYNEIVNLTHQYVADGFEGIMLRNMNEAYDFKRSNALLKFKLFKESDFTIVDFVEGKGKYVGTLGALVVNEGIVTAEVGTGFTDEERDVIWSMRSTLLGKPVEVKYQEITDSGKSLRFPVFSKFK